MPTPTVARVDPRLRAAAFHEVGHAVVATVLGGRIHRAVLTPDDPATAGHCSYDDLPAAHDPAITYAGPYAETYAAVGGPPTARKVRDTLLRNHQDHASLVAAGDPRPAEVPRIVATTWQAIDGLARLLYREMTISQADVDAALGLPDGERNPEAREHALAAIRAGSVPGTFEVTSPRLTDWKL
ncbi:M50 family metallopeptidase [Tsukamurella asaccharolytica]|uniref:M50 family metallopeptidase n=1 Tax=Tsukamurella asaccharolytica TaxID=2592067 RepID=UPI0013153306|nr:M50 family metallopeptidase [Tsukamurella asaccharolytica]